MEYKNVSQVIDILGLMGDASDNIPGIKGVGEKTAIKLLQEYDSIEDILDHADEIKGALGKKIREGKEDALLSKKLATIIIDVPCAFNEEKFKIEPINNDALNAIFTELEFKSLGKRILGEQYSVFESVPKKVVQPSLFDQDTTSKAKPAEQKEAAGLVAESKIENTPHKYTLVKTDDAIDALIEKLAGESEISFDTETTGLDANEAELVGMSFAIKPHEAWYVPVPESADGVKKLLERFRGVFEDEKKTWIGQNIKYDLLILRWYGFGLKGRLFDTMLAHYLIESEGRRNMDLLSAQYLGYVPVPITDLIGKKEKGNFPCAISTATR